MQEAEIENISVVEDLQNSREDGGEEKKEVDVHDEDGAETKCMKTKKGQKRRDYFTPSSGIPLHSPKRFAEEIPILTILCRQQVTNYSMRMRNNTVNLRTWAICNQKKTDFCF